ncbi:MAG: tetratricopeptide repeat protein [Candidatus Riflebacteria bacterium]|nr:tetratricopeptide repeat protein [Candidatus Riflebacteria bacterium]
MKRPFALLMSFLQYCVGFAPHFSINTNSGKSVGNSFPLKPAFINRLIVQTSFIFLILLIWFPAVIYAGENEKELLALLGKNPNNRKALIGLSELYRIPIKWVNAKVLADEMAANLKSGNGNEEILVQTVSLYESISLFQQAINTLSEYLKKNPRAVKPILFTGWENYLAGNFSDALYWYDLAIRNSPNLLEGWQGKLVTLIAMKDFGAARELGKSILSRDPGNATASIKLGDIEYHLKNYSESFKYYSIDPNNPDCKLGLGLSLYRQGKFEEAQTYLASAKKSFPLNMELNNALSEIDKLEIEQIENQISEGFVQKNIITQKKLHLAGLYEEEGRFKKSADLLKDLPESMSSYDYSIRIAELYFKAKSFRKAARFYELAAQYSKTPRATRLLAIDSLMLAPEYSEAKGLLDKLAKEAPGYDLEKRNAAIYFATSRIEDARKIFQKVARNFESKADGSPMSKSELLSAVDNYLDGKFYNDAERILNLLKSQSLDSEYDERAARLYLETDRFLDAIQIYSIYPENVDMQISKAWALMKINQKRAATDIFRAILKKNPLNEAVKADLDAITNYINWDVGTSYTNVNFGAYKAKHERISEVVKYLDEGIMAAVSYSDEHLLTKSKGAYDFGEKLTTFKLKYDFTKEFTGNFHVLSFQSEDPVCDGAIPLGANFWYHCNPEWAFGLELDEASYDGLTSRQVDFMTCYSPDPRVTVEGGLTRIKFDGGSIRPSSGSTADSIKGKVKFTPEKKLSFDLSGWWGDRRLYIDSEEAFAYTIPDLYLSGWAFSTTYRFASWIKGYFSYSSQHFVSEWQAAHNEKVWERVYDPNQSVNLISGGIDLLF